MRLLVPAKTFATSLLISTNRRDFYQAPYYENKDFADFHPIYSCLPAVFAMAARSQSTAGRRLSRGYTAEGQSALLSRTTGIYNTGIGIYSLLSLTTGSFNTAIRAGALLAKTGNENTATGAGALLNDQNSVQNTANGAFALFSNTNNNANTATGYQALFQKTVAPTRPMVGQRCTII